MLCITLKYCFRKSKFLFLPKRLQARWLLYIHLEKDQMPCFLLLCHIFSFGSSDLNCRFIRREYGFSINSKIPLMRSNYKPILILKISVIPIKIHLENFNILQILILKLYFLVKIVSSELSCIPFLICNLLLGAKAP